jgi:predicted RecB family nuclease
MLYISPSRVARYFFHECERHLVYSATPENEKKQKSIPIPPYEHNPVTQSILDSGLVWEEEVVEKLSRLVHMADSEEETPVSDRHFQETDTLKKLRTISPGEYLYQGCLIAPQSFYEAYRLDPSYVKVSNCFPDLIYVTEDRGNLKFRVIDVKASEEMKIAHKVQVTLYSLILSHILKEKNIRGYVDLSEGGVWTYGKNEPQWFNMDTIRPQVEEMLSVDLCRISKSEPEKVHWHIQYRCEWCEYFDFCFKEAKDTKNISLIPYLTPHGKKHLSSEERGIKDLNTMEEFLQRPEALKILSQCASLSGKKDRLLKSVQSLLEDKIIPYGGASVSMPSGENIKLLLTIQKDSLSGNIYAAGLLRSGSDDIFQSKNRHEEQFIAETPGDCQKVRKDFINRIYEIFKEVHDYNGTKEEWKEKKSLQTYVFDSFESHFLRELLMESLKDETLSEKALPLLFYFHSEDLLTADDQPESEMSFPVIVLTQVINSLFAMPVPVACKLDSSVKTFVKEDIFQYSSSDYFTFNLYNALKSDCINDVWNRGKTDRLEWIGKEIKKRLWATLHIVNGIRNFVSTLPDTVFFAWPPKFNFPLSEGFSEPLLSRLSFIVRYESIVECLSLRALRTLPGNERETRGIAFSLRAAGDNSFSVMSNNGELLQEGGSWLLSEDTPEGERAQMTFPDFYYRDKPFMPKGKPLYGATLEEINHKEVTLKLTKPSQSSPPVINGKDYLLQPRFMEWNSNRVSARLHELDGTEKNMLELLSSPLSYLKEIEESEHFREETMKIVEKINFTESQKKAFNHLFSKNLTLVWGPPGTGKTYFIALSLLCLLEAHRKQRRPFKILISAFTHAAIENCLKKAVELNNSLNIWKEEVFIKKIGPVQTRGCRIIEQIKVNETSDCFDTMERCLLGGTTYSMLKAFKGDISKPFDMVVLDEGSQVRVPESLLPISRLKEGGRLLIAGDDKQLPPIIKGYYPPVEEDEPLLHRSIFEALRKPDKENKITSILLENFRMNETLCIYPAKIYNENYKSATEEIAKRKLSLSCSSSSDHMIEAIIDPQFPLTVCVLEGIRTGAENLLEADLVAHITEELRKRLLMKDSKKDYSNDGLFWKEGLFIVSPHHVQIDAIKKALEERGLYESFVDTVDKMQGQECDCVIVSYGVSDPELAMMEGEFIYSLNRLNVAITRAKSKTIVFLSRHLLTPTIQVLENPEAIEGISYMVGLERFAAGAGNSCSFHLGNNVSLVIHRK